MIVRYRIDSEDRITDVDEGWITFAQQNAGGQLLPPGIQGRTLWPEIADETTRQVYHALIDRVRQNGTPVRFRFRCDAPDQRRLLQMQIAVATSGEVAFETNLLFSQQRAKMLLIDTAAPRSDAMLTICGWCMRVALGDGAWAEIEDAIPALGLFEASVMPELSHGMCPTCFEAMMGALDDPDLAASGNVTLGALTSG